MQSCCEFSFNIQTRLSSVRGSMTKLVPLARRYHIARESRFMGAGISMSEHGYIDAADRCCLRRLTWSNICLIFTAATRLSFHQQWPVAVCYTSPPVQGATRMRESWGAGGFELRKRSQTKMKRNET